jgi:adenylylsulfate kinase-like enzyme
MMGFDDAVRLATARQEARLIAVDGLPLAGKSTLAGKLAAALQAGIVPESVEIGVAGVDG